MCTMVAMRLVEETTEKVSASCVCDGALSFYSRATLISSNFIACVFSRVYASDLLLGFLIGPVSHFLVLNLLD